MPHRHLKLLIISSLRYVYFSRHHGGFPLAEKTASFQTQLASTETAVFLECIQVILHLLCGLWQQTAGFFRQVKMLRAGKKAAFFFWVLWLCRANLLRFLWKISMGILPNSWRFQDFQTGIVSASWSPPDRLLRWSWGRTTKTLVNMATPLKDSLWNPVFCLWKHIAKITPRYPLVI